MFQKRKQLNQGLEVICELNQQFTSKPQQRLLSRIYLSLNIFLRFYILFQIFLLGSLFYCFYRDFHIGYSGQVSFFLIIQFCIMLAAVLITVFYVTSCGIFWLQMYIVVAVFNRIKLKKLKTRFYLLINNFKGEFIDSTLPSTLSLPLRYLYLSLYPLIRSTSL